MVNCSWSAFIFFPPVSFKLLSSIIFSLLSPSTPTHHFQFCLPIILIAWFPTLGRTCPCHLSFFSSYLNFIAFKLLSDYTQFETLSILVIPCNLHILPPLLNFDTFIFSCAFFIALVSTGYPYVMAYRAYRRLAGLSFSFWRNSFVAHSRQFAPVSPACLYVR